MRSSFVLPWLAACACGSAAPIATVVAAPSGPRTIASETAPAHAPATAAARPPAVELALVRLPSRHVVLALSPIDGGPALSFILDTGASLSVITPRSRDRFGISPDAGLAVQGRGAGGDLGDLRVVVLPEFAIGARHYRGHTAAVAELAELQARLAAPVDGILGRNFVEQHVLVLDFAAERLRLLPADALALGEVELAGTTTVELEPLAVGLLGFQAVLEGRTLRAVLDLGADRTVINWKAAEAAGLERGRRGPRTSPDRLLGADSRTLAAHVHRFRSLTAGGLELGQGDVYIADLPVFDSLGMAQAPAMVFGIDRLEGRRVVLDWRARRLYLSQPPSSPT